MSVDTREANRRLDRHAGQAQVWLFGYGSLIYKVDFPYLERRVACIRHWTRRFWQGSHDHRGTPEAPGRVVTLIREPDAVCIGMAYLIAPAVFAQLDLREKNGYLRFGTELQLGQDERAEGLVYIATEENAAFLGPASAAEIAATSPRHPARAGQTGTICCSSPPRCASSAHTIRTCSTWSAIWWTCWPTSGAPAVPDRGRRQASAPLSADDRTVVRGQPRVVVRRYGYRVISMAWIHKSGWHGDCFMDSTGPSVHHGDIA